MDERAECELCVPESVLCGNDLAYARLDSNSLSEGHVIVVPRRHVADFFEMTASGKGRDLGASWHGAANDTSPTRAGWL